MGVFKRLYLLIPHAEFVRHAATRLNALLRTQMTLTTTSMSRLAAISGHSQLWMMPNLRIQRVKHEKSARERTQEPNGREFWTAASPQTVREGTQEPKSRDFRTAASPKDCKQGSTEDSTWSNHHISSCTSPPTSLIVKLWCDCVSGHFGQPGLHF